MSGFGDFPSVRVWILSRFVLWLPVGSLAVLITLLALNIPSLRSPNGVAVLCLCIGILAAFWPDLSVLIGQTAIASIILVALICATQAAVSSRVRRRSVFSTRPATNTLETSDLNTTGRTARSNSNPDRPASEKQLLDRANRERSQGDRPSSVATDQKV